MGRDAQDLMCPSAQPDMEGARVIGVVAGDADAPMIAYLDHGVRIDDSVVDALGVLDPGEVFRFAAKCERNRCVHFAGGCCSLASRIVDQLPEVVQLLPRCQIRATCRWFAEQGGAACRRCPQVLTRIPKADDALNRAARAPTELPTPG